MALAQNNDPFYTGSPAHVKNAEWFAKVYEDMGSPRNVHIRRIHYALVAKADVVLPSMRGELDGTLYKNIERDWNFLAAASKYARYLGLAPVDNFVDRRNPEPVIEANYFEYDSLERQLKTLSIRRLVSDIAQKFSVYNPQNSQAYHLEIWCEKSTMNDVILPVADKFCANAATSLGEFSITAVRNLIERIVRADKPVRIFYISDFDPAGQIMPVSVARKIEYFSRQMDGGVDVKLSHLMLTADQCREYELPRTPIKESDLRKAGFEERHGTGATELDALEALYPGEMEALKQFISHVILDTPAVEIAVAVCVLLLAVIVCPAWVRSRRRGKQKP